MNPILLLAVICGGASGVLTFSILGAGLVATPSPGSIFALIAMTPRGGYFGVLAGVLVATAVSFLVASVFVKKSANSMDDAVLDDAKDMVLEIKNVGVKKIVSKIIFACDAGMGSSAMGATTLRNKFKKAGLNIEVVNMAVEDIPDDAEMVVIHESLVNRAKSKAPKAEFITITNFIDSPEYDKLVNRMK
jgi:PTS system mannitol-specific IIC component